MIDFSVGIMQNLSCVGENALLLSSVTVYNYELNLLSCFQLGGKYFSEQQLCFKCVTNNEIKSCC